MIINIITIIFWVIRGKKLQKVGIFSIFRSNQDPYQN